MSQTSLVEPNKQEVMTLLEEIHRLKWEVQTVNKLASQFTFLNNLISEIKYKVDRIDFMLNNVSFEKIKEQINEEKKNV